MKSGNVEILFSSQFEHLFVIMYIHIRNDNNSYKMICFSQHRSLNACHKKSQKSQKEESFGTSFHEQHPAIFHQSLIYNNLSKRKKKQQIQNK